MPVVLDGLGPALGRRLLDVGTGTGALAEAALDRGFQVEGVDAEPTMIDFARRRRGQTGVHFRVGHLPDLDHPTNSIDAATANFVVNHTPEPLASLREISRVIRPGGPVAVTIWPVRTSALNAIWTEVIERSGAVRPSIPRLDAIHEFDRTVDGLRKLMTDAGLQSVIGSEVTWTFRIAPDELWEAVPAGIAVIGTVYRAQGEATRTRMRAAYDAVADRLRTGTELELPMTCILGVGAAP